MILTETTQFLLPEVTGMDRQAFPFFISSGINLVLKICWWDMGRGIVFLHERGLSDVAELPQNDHIPVLSKTDC